MITGGVGRVGGVHKSNHTSRENTRNGVELEPMPGRPPIRLHTSPLSYPPSESRVGGNDRYPAFRRGNDNLLRFTTQGLLSYKQVRKMVRR